MYKIVAILSILCSALAFSAYDDEPSELNWENFAGNMDVFAHFLNYQADTPCPVSTTAVSCPDKFPVISLPPSAFAGNLGVWRLSEQDGTAVLAAQAGHRVGMCRAKLRIAHPGFYRIWVKYYHQNRKHASFSLRILDAQLLHERFSAVVSSKGEYYSHRFDWAEETCKRSVALHVGQDKPDGFRWESGYMAAFDAGEYTLELSGLIHAGPYGGRKIAAIVLSADPLLDSPEILFGLDDYPASKDTQRHWQLWCNRPGATALADMDLQSQQYYLQWRNSFIQKLAENPETDSELRLASQAYFDEQVNLIGTPADIATEKKRLEDALHYDASKFFAFFLEAEEMLVSPQADTGWKGRDYFDASQGRILESSYADGTANASANVKIPKAGTYWVWVRYFLFHKLFSLFDLEFLTDAGSPLTVLHYGQPEDRLLRQNNMFTWECFPLELPPGKLQLKLSKNIGKEPRTFRRIDKIFISDEQSLHPDEFQNIGSEPADVLWMQNDPWKSFSRISLPGHNDIVNPDVISLQIHQSDTASVLLHLRNNRTSPIDIEPVFSGTGAPQLRLLAYQKTPLYSWTPAVLLERRRLTFPPRQNTSLWLSFKTEQLGSGNYTPELYLGTRKIKFNLTILPDANRKPVPLVGGWCPPLERESCWQLFREIGINLIFKVVASKQEMNKYKIRHFALFKNLLEGSFLQSVLQFREQSQFLGLSAADWSIILLDEPNPERIQQWLILARELRSNAPDIQIWCNPGEIQTCTTDIVRQMRPYIDVFCPYMDHFRSREEEYRKQILPDIGKIKLIYSTPCFKEKSPDSPQEILRLGKLASQYDRHGWAYFSLFWGYPYSNSIWDEMNAYSTSQCINVYPGAYGRTLSTRNLEAVREAIQRYRK